MFFPAPPGSVSKPFVLALILLLLFLSLSADWTSSEHQQLQSEQAFSAQSPQAAEGFSRVKDQARCCSIAANALHDSRHTKLTSPSRNALQIIQELSVSNELLEVSELCCMGCVQTDHDEAVSEEHAHCSKGTGTSTWKSPHAPVNISI